MLYGAFYDRHGNEQVTGSKLRSCGASFKQTWIFDYIELCIVLKHQHKTHQKMRWLTMNLRLVLYTCLNFLMGYYKIIRWQIEVNCIFLGYLFLLTLEVNYPFDNNNIQDNCITFFIYLLWEKNSNIISFHIYYYLFTFCVFIFFSQHGFFLS